MVLFNGIRAQCGTSIISKHWVLRVQHINLVVMIVKILAPLRNAFFSAVHNSLEIKKAMSVVLSFFFL